MVPASLTPCAQDWCLRWPVQWQPPLVAMGAALPPTPKGFPKASLPTPLHRYGSPTDWNTAASWAAVLQLLSPRNFYKKLFPAALAGGRETQQGAHAPSPRHLPCFKPHSAGKLKCRWSGLTGPRGGGGLAKNFFPPLQKARASRWAWANAAQQNPPLGHPPSSPDGWAATHSKGEKAQPQPYLTNLSKMGGKKPCEIGSFFLKKKKSILFIFFCSCFWAPSPPVQRAWAGRGCEEAAMAGLGRALSLPSREGGWAPGWSPQTNAAAFS